MSRASCAEVTGNRLSRRLARTANVPCLPAVSCTAAEIAASGSLATRTARQTRTIPITVLMRSAIKSTAASAAARSTAASGAPAAAPPGAAPRSAGECPAGRDGQHDHSFPLPQLQRDAEIADRAPDVVMQQALELLAVLALEHDLAQLEQHARFGQARRPRRRDAISQGQCGHSLSLPARRGFPAPCTKLYPCDPAAGAGSAGRRNNPAWPGW